MPFKDELLDQFIEQIVQEQKETENMRTIVLDYFKDKPMSEIVKITGSLNYSALNYSALIKKLKSIRQYNYEHDYYYDIEYFLFKHFSEKAVEIQLLYFVPEELMDTKLFDVYYILEENNQLYLLASSEEEGTKFYFFQEFKIETKEMQLTYDFSKELKELKEKYNKKLKIEINSH